MIRELRSLGYRVELLPAPSGSSDDRERFSTLTAPVELGFERGTFFSAFPSKGSERPVLRGFSGRRFVEQLSRLCQAVRYGFRGLRKDRAFALLSVFALALGIGATTVIFSVIDNVLLEPFPYTGADRLTDFFIHDTTRADNFGRGDFSIPEFLDYKEQNHVFEG